MNRASGLEAPQHQLLQWLAQHITAPRLLWLLALLCFLIAWNRGIALLYGLLALILALLLVSWVLPGWMMRGLQVQRQVLGNAVAGGAVRLRYRFAGRRPVFYLHIREQLPGTEQADGHFLAQIRPGDELTLSYTTPQRGVFTLPPVQLSCAWPFGFIERQLPATGPGLELLVWPQWFPVRQLPQPATDNPVMEGADSFLSRGAHSEFAGVRPYRDGDSMRLVHWAASARQQQLVVREFHSYDTPSWLMIVDAQAGNALGQGADTTFEYALQIAASLLHYAQENHLRLTLVISGRQPLRLTLEPGTRDLRDHLDALARVTDDGDTPYAQIIQQELAALQEQPVLLTVRRSSQPLAVTPRGGHLDVVYADDSFVHPLQQYPEGWRTLKPGVLQLQLHRRSQLAQIFASGKGAL